MRNRYSSYSPRSAGSKVAVLVGTLAVAALVSGCATSNLTGFSFPSFNLIGKKQQDDPARNLNPNASHSNRLIDAPTR